MSREPAKHDQLSLTLRIAAGAYLIYTAWKLRTAVAERPLFLIAIVVFAAAGLFLAAHAAWRLYKGQYAAPGSQTEEEDIEEKPTE